VSRGLTANSGGFVFVFTRKHDARVDVDALRNALEPIFARQTKHCVRQVVARCLCCTHHGEVLLRGNPARCCTSVWYPSVPNQKKPLCSITERFCMVAYYANFRCEITTISGLGNRTIVCSSKSCVRVHTSVFLMFRLRASQKKQKTMGML